LDAVYEGDLQKIRTWIAANIGVSEDHGFILMSREMTIECLEAVRRTLLPLVAMVKSK
jgi:hypothetical protein